MPSWELDMRTPTDVEDAYYADIESPETAHAASKNTWNQDQGNSRCWGVDDW
jgi:hypothetical protein